MNRAEKAVEFKHDKHNCCQAVLAAFEDVTGFPKDTMRRLGVAFGSGMGGMEGTCGALCGAEMVLGMKSDGKPLHARAKELHQAFREKAGATICKELKGIETGKMLCSCDDCVRFATEIVEQM